MNSRQRRKIDAAEHNAALLAAKERAKLPRTRTRRRHSSNAIAMMTSFAVMSVGE